MKRLAILIMVLAIFVAPAIAQEVITPKIAVTYNIDSDTLGEAIGGAVKEDVYIEGLDIDVLVESNVGGTLTNDEKTVITGLSYNYDFNDKLTAGIGAGLSAIEFNGDEIDIDEHDKYIYASLSYKF